MEKTRQLGPGTIIDRRFQVGKLLGAGGYGEVYEAHQLSMQRKIVLKVLRPHLVRKQKIVERFQNEARYACRLTHPNTVVRAGHMNDQAVTSRLIAPPYFSVVGE